MNSDSPRRVLRFGVLHGGGALENWQTGCLEALASVPGVTAAFSVAPDRYRIPLTAAWAALPNVPMTVFEGPSAACSVDAAAIAQLRLADLDFLLSFFEGALPAGILDVPRYGVWRLQWGDWLNYRGSPPGFWEVYDGCAASAAMLVRVSGDPDVIGVLRTAVLRTNTLSVRGNRGQFLARVAAWPADVCRAYGAGGAGGVVGAELLADAPSLRSGVAQRHPPSAWQRAVLGVRIAARAAAVGLKSLFRHDQWNIGIVDQPVEQFLGSAGHPRACWLPAMPRAELRADPFGVVYEGRPTILCEQFSYRDNVGTIVAIDVERGVPGIPVRIGPRQPVHLSYPFLFEAGGRLYCVPESSAAREIALYEADHFPDRWVKSAALIEGSAFVDATLFSHEGRWWLSASDVARKGANSELHLWFAAAPAGPWTAHPGNPVKIDVRSARPAGPPFRVDGVLYRPAQDCSSTYGARVVINRVLKLTPDDFREEWAGTVDPDPDGAYPDGLHTLSTLGEKTLIDGKRSVFVAAEFYRVLRHYLSRASAS